MRSSEQPVVAAGPIRALGRAVPLHFIGDSNSVIHHDMMYSSAPGNTGTAIVRTSWCAHLTASNFTSSSGELDPRVLSSLLTALTLIGDDEGWGQKRRGEILAEFTRRVGGSDCWDDDLDEGFLHPVAVIFAGTIDVRNILGSLGADADFPYDSPRVPHLPAVPPAARRHYAAGLVRDMVDAALAPLFHGLRAIRDAGITNLFLHGVAPPNAEPDGEFAQLVGPYPVALRYKVALVMNERMAQFCRQDDIGFIDIWDRVVGSDGLVDDAFVFDYGHLNQRAALLTMEHLYAALDDRRSRPR